MCYTLVTLKVDKLLERGSGVPFDILGSSALFSSSFSSSFSGFDDCDRLDLPLFFFSFDILGSSALFRSSLSSSSLGFADGDKLDFPLLSLSSWYSALSSSNTSELDRRASPCWSSVLSCHIFQIHSI